MILRRSIPPLVESDNGATLDLSPLIRDFPTFAAERQLQAALLAAGLVLSPGEAHGFKRPGFFRICCAHLTDAQVEEVGQRLSRVLQTFKPTDASLLTKRRATDDDAAAAAAVADEGEEGVQSPKKKRR